MKRYFLTGLMVLLPAVVTIGLLILVANILTRPFMGLIEYTLKEAGVIGTKEVAAPYLRLVIEAASLFFVIAATIFVGILGHIYVLKFFGKWGEFIIQRIPVVNKIYSAARDVVQTLLIGAHGEQKFSKVALVPYPSKQTLSIGLVPSEFLPEGSDEEHMGQIPVFVPGSPNPTMGFMIMYNRDEVEMIDMSVEEALHMIISLGVVWETKRPPTAAL